MSADKTNRVGQERDVGADVQCSQGWGRGVFLYAEVHWDVRPFGTKDLSPFVSRVTPPQEANVPGYNPLLTH